MKNPDNYEKDKVEKYAKYFQGNIIVPIPEVTKALKPRTLFFVVVNLKTKRLASLKKKTPSRNWWKATCCLQKNKQLN